MSGEASLWLESTGVNLDELLLYGKRRYNYSPEQILEAVQRAYDERDVIRNDQVGHEIWSRVDKGDAPNETASAWNCSHESFESLALTFRTAVYLYAIHLVYLILKGTIL